MVGMWWVTASFTSNTWWPNQTTSLQNKYESQVAMLPTFTFMIFSIIFLTEWTYQIMFLQWYLSLKPAQKNTWFKADKIAFELCSFPLGDLRPLMLYRRLWIFGRVWFGSNAVSSAEAFQKFLGKDDDSTHILQEKNIGCWAYHTAYTAYTYRHGLGLL